jgi:hypothetical protein
VHLEVLRPRPEGAARGRCAVGHAIPVAPRVGYGQAGLVQPEYEGCGLEVQRLGHPLAIERGDSDEITVFVHPPTFSEGVTAWSMIGFTPSLTIFTLTIVDPAPCRNNTSTGPA